MELPKTIIFENTEADLLKGMKAIHKFSDTQKLIRRITLGLVTIMALHNTVSQAVERYNEVNLGAIIFFMLMFAILFGLFYAIIYLINFIYLKICFHHLVSKARKAKGILGKHELIIEEDQFTERTEFNEARVKWAGVPMIRLVNDFILLYQTVHSAHVIPQHAFMSEEDFLSFYRLLCQLKEKSEHVGLT